MPHRRLETPGAALVTSSDLFAALFDSNWPHGLPHVVDASDDCRTELGAQQPTFGALSAASGSQHLTARGVERVRGGQRDGLPGFRHARNLAPGAHWDQVLDPQSLHREHEQVRGPGRNVRWVMDTARTLR